MYTSYRYINHIGASIMMTKEQILEQDSEDPIIKKLLIEKYNGYGDFILIKNIDDALDTITNFYDNLIKEKLRSMNEEEQKRILKNPMSIILSDGTITDIEYILNKEV